MPVRRVADVVAGALAVVYLVVVPSLERRLVDAKLAQLENVAPTLVEEFPRSQFFWQEFADQAEGIVNARVVIYDLYDRTPPVVRAQADSGPELGGVQKDSVAREAALAGALRRGTVDRGGERFAEVAFPVTAGGPFLLLSAGLRDPLGTVELVERRLLLAGVLALAVALALGYGLARMFARRIRRLERAADRIAGGRFDEPIIDPAVDELGELARGFDRMRLRLAHLDHARREFIANASHELRTPLFSLGGFLELLADEELDDATRREFLDTMREQVERLTKLATDLLDLTRLDAGRLHVERRPLDLSSLAGSLADEFRALAHGSGHTLELAGSDAVTAVGDEQRVLQIGRALVENALIHTPPGTTVTIRAQSDDSHTALVVQDDGPGIPPEHVGQVFERFYRVDGTRAAGSGLGLSIARELAELMDGRVVLDSQPGRTAVTLTLPRPEAISRENAGRDQVATVRG